MNNNNNSSIYYNTIYIKSLTPKNKIKFLNMQYNINEQH